MAEDEANDVSKRVSVLAQKIGEGLEKKLMATPGTYVATHASGTSKPSHEEERMARKHYVWLVREIRRLAIGPNSNVTMSQRAQVLGTLADPRQLACLRREAEGMARTYYRPDVDVNESKAATDERKKEAVW